MSKAKKYLEDQLKITRDQQLKPLTENQQKVAETREAGLARTLTEAERDRQNG